MGSDPRLHLCAILKGESTDLPSGDERARLLAAARVHRVDRLIAWRTGGIDDECRGQAILDELDVRELNRVLEALEAHGVGVLVLKGAALAHTHYEQSWLRPRLDADLLIASAQRHLTGDVLRDLGYVRPPFISGDLVMYQTPFVRSGPSGHEHALDVHWRVANPQVLADLPGYDECASRACTVTVRGQPMRTLCPVDSLLVACVHRAAHHALADDLLWLYDIHLLARRLGPAEWSEFISLASDRHVRGLCGNGLKAAHDCFDTAIPPHVDSHLAAADGERSSVYLRKDLTRLDRLVADLGALGPRARVRLVFEHLIPPARYVSQKYGVRHSLLLPLFYLHRVVGGLGRFVGR